MNDNVIRAGIGHACFERFDIISPWTVGRYMDQAGVSSFRSDVMAGDLSALAETGIDYMPVAFPGFSWHNLTGGSSPLNLIPRDGGHFFWRQVYEWLSAGCSSLYVAMFDEVDEGTAMYKIAPTAADVPTEGTFLTLDADGYDLPSDHYLWLAGEAARMVRGEIPLSSTWPTRP